MEMNGELHASAILPEERASGTHWTEDWMGPKTNLVAEETIKMSHPCMEFNPRSLVIQ